MQTFLKHIIDALDNERLFKVTLSKPKSKSDQIKNIFFRPISLGGKTSWNATYHYLTNDKTKNIESDALVNVMKDLLEHTFYNADMFQQDKKITLLQSKKGKSKVIQKMENHPIEIESHNHKKKRLISQDSPFLIDLGISSSGGHVFGHAQDKFKQINKFVELVTNLIKGDTTVNSIFDMGSGKGYLTFALHSYLVQNYNNDLKTVGVEIREDLVNKCNAIARKNEFKGLSFELGSIDEFNIGTTDIVIALHACDIATDMAIAKGVESNAKYIVVAPCCHKQIRNEMQNTGSIMDSILQYGILKERQAEMITDTIRALLLESKGYEVKVFEFISSEHTGKNVMLTAKKRSKANTTALEKVAALKSEFGIKSHFLEKLLSQSN